MAGGKPLAHIFDNMKYSFLYAALSCWLSINFFCPSQCGAQSNSSAPIDTVLFDGLLVIPTCTPTVGDIVDPDSRYYSASMWNNDVELHWLRPPAHGIFVYEQGVQKGIFFTSHSHLGTFLTRTAADSLRQLYQHTRWDFAKHASMTHTRRIDVRIRGFWKNRMWNSFALEHATLKYIPIGEVKVVIPNLAYRHDSGHRSSSARRKKEALKTLRVPLYFVTEVIQMKPVDEPK